MAISVASTPDVGGTMLPAVRAPVVPMLKIWVPPRPRVTYRNVPFGLTARWMGAPPAGKGEPGIWVREPFLRSMVNAEMLFDPLLATNKKFVFVSMTAPVGATPTVKGEPAA